MAGEFVNLQKLGHGINKIIGQVLWTIRYEKE